MSAIVGIFHPDGRPVDAADVERMTTVLAHRGPDGRNVWQEGAVGLGHCMLWTTPESMQERLPFADPAAGLVITADARIDNRAELISLLDLDDRPVGEIGDSELILAAYVQWGERCPERLLGDFAFAIWDERKQSLFCARDHAGVKPFYYYLSSRFFAFASEIKALLSLPDVPRRLNEGQLGDYLAGIFSKPVDTFYQGILRLPPAHWMTVTRSGVRREVYWALDPGKNIHLASDREYGEALRGIFTEAVGCRLRSARPPGAYLSGGLDSSAVACVAERLMAQEGRGRLQTFSAVFDEVTACDERQFIRAVLDQGQYEPHFVNGDQISPLGDLERIFWHQDEVFHAPGLFLTWRLLEAVSRQDVRIVLDGHGGDEVISYGAGRLRELAHNGHWLSLVVQAHGIARIFGEPLWEVLWPYLRYAFARSKLANSALHRSVGFARRVLRRKRNAGSDPMNGRVDWKSILNRRFIRETDLEERFRIWQETQPDRASSEREVHHRALTDARHSYGFEVLDRAAAAFSVEPCYPFWDRRLVEYCLALPSEQKLDRGWSRIVLRRAMAGVIPPVVQWRADKTDFSPNFARSLWTYDRERLDGLVLKRSGALDGFVDTSVLTRLYDQYVSVQGQMNMVELGLLWRVMSVGLWIEHGEFAS